MSAQSGLHAVALSVVRVRGLDLEPSPSERPEAFAGRVLDAMAEHLAAFIEDRIQTPADALQRRVDQQKAARALRWAVTDLGALVGDIAALSQLLDEEGVAS